MVYIDLTQTRNNLSNIELLKSSPYFHGLDEFTFERIGKLMTERKVHKKEIIWLEEEPAKIIYFVVSGLIKLFKTSARGKEQILRLVHPGDCFGHTGVFNGGSNPESAQAITSSLLYGLIGSDLEALFLENNQLAVNTIRAQAVEIHEYVSLIEDLSLRYVNGRLAKILLEYSSGDICDISLLINKSDIAAMAGTVREVIWKALKNLEDDGIIIKNRQKIIINNRRALKTIADSFL